MVVTETMGSTKPKIVTTGPLQSEFSDPCSGGSMIQYVIQETPCETVPDGACV
jgi:hypothetical protein